MKLIEIVKKIEENDENFNQLVEKIGILDGFSVGESIFAPHRFRDIFLTALLVFRPVYLIDQKLEPSKYITPEPLFNTNGFALKIGDEISLDVLSTWLIENGYSREYHAETNGDFSIQGGNVDIFEQDSDFILQIELFGDEIEQLSLVENHTRKVISRPETAIINPVQSSNIITANMITKSKNNIEEEDQLDIFLDVLPANALVVIKDPDLIDDDNLDKFLEVTRKLSELNVTTISFVSLGGYKNSIKINDEDNVKLFLEKYEELSDIKQQRKEKNNQANRRDEKKPIENNRLDVKDLEIGDFVVHDLHGIGQYVGREERVSEFNFDEDGNKIVEEYLVIKYAPRGKKTDEPDYLYVAVTNPENLAKYVGADNPKLSKFGGVEFAKIKKKTRKYAQDIARKLVKIYASRINSEGYIFYEDDDEMKEMESLFEFELTPDQERAIEDVKNDMEAPYPMDRLICADVGFGKTEVAIRAAFKAVLSGKQVAILAPTTILSSQHYETFSRRLEKFPVNIALLNRFTPREDKKNILIQLEAGLIDIIIGTHSILNDKVIFKDLGLLVIDEEQRFGTAQKEKIKQKHPQIDILTLSATPIPRTLEMALTGIRDISLIATPPENRQPIQTSVLESSDKLVKDVIEFELQRGGQVFFVHNNISTLLAKANKIAELIPGARIGIAHSRLSEGRIDKIIDQFWKKEIDVLVCTTIIETGLDIANANTLIVDRAERFGLTQLHQLRGRVGRSEIKAYAYFFYSKGKTITEAGYKRLETLQDLSELGQGTAIAMKDLEIRGSGDYLGREQSGKIAGVGYDLYVRIMAQAVENLRDLED
ncbi:MAG: DEAD/DEAH box helicase [Candidatus Ancillula sp.]|jgi:transcription-repair coupling factor|nr:DEAD/DEAH box helicase [Candidatus Ancillula sp.]